MRIGIPRSFFFFRFHPSVKVFFEKLGVEILVSPPATRATLENGLLYAIPESCLPLKLFYGHVRALVGQVDAIFVPSIQRFAIGSTNCAKIIALPDLLRASMSDLPQLIAPDIDLSQGMRTLWSFISQEASRLSLNPLNLYEASQLAWDTYQQTQQSLLAGTLTPASFDKPQPEGLPSGNGLTIALVGHPYNLYEPFANHNLLVRLTRLGVRLLTPERLGPQPGVDYWTFEYELLGALKLALERKELAGVIAVLAFGCGPDGAMLETVQRMTAQAGVPLMTLSLDEHSGEAGLVTRLEAFVDMLNWRKKAHGLQNTP